jgi:hypothetical protein
MESKREDVMKRISQLRRLQLTGEISESEFDEQKEKILAEALPGSRAPEPASIDTRLPYRDTEARHGNRPLTVILPVVGLIALFAAVWLYGNFAHKIGRDSAPPPRIALRVPPPAVSGPPVSSAVPTAPLSDSESTSPTPSPKTAVGADVPPPAAAEPTPLNDRETSNERETALPLDRERKASDPPRDSLKAQTTEKSLPTAIGRCAETMVTKVVRRPYENGDPALANFGSAIQYKNGGGQISSEQNAGIDASIPGDRVQICLVTLPHNCPRGDNQGAVYHAINLRTGLDWEAPNSEHACGGA